MSHCISNQVNFKINFLICKLHLHMACKSLILICLYLFEGVVVAMPLKRSFGISLFSPSLP